MNATVLQFDATLVRIVDRSGSTPLTAAGIAFAKSGPAVHVIVAQRIAASLGRLVASGELVEVLPGRFVTARFNTLAA